MTNLVSIKVYAGECKHCRRDAGKHSLNGRCMEGSVPSIPTTFYDAPSIYAFIDPDNRFAIPGARIERY